MIGDESASEVPPRSYSYILFAASAICGLLAAIGGLVTYGYIIEPLDNQDRYQLMVIPVLAVVVSLPFSFAGILCCWRCRQFLSATVILSLLLLLAAPWFPIVVATVHDGIRLSGG